ncbi:MAG: hypothetical protein KC561_12470 [Myxococcales bacterium]|nr:hypothetical protein [Myxococcales bacterium]
MNRVIRPTAAAFLACLFVLSHEASAQDSVPRVFDYDGILELDGQLVDGDFDMIFTIYDSSGNAVWSEEHSTIPGTSDCSASCSVSFNRGRFAVVLGSYVDLEHGAGDSEGEPLFNGQDDSGYQIGITVYRDGSPVELSGRQTIAVVPYALWTVGAGDFDISGTLTADSMHVEGNTRNTCNVNLSGNLDVSSGGLDINGLALEGQLNIGGALTLVSDLEVEGTLATTGGDIEVVNRSNVNQRTMVRANASTVSINPDSEFEDGVEIGGRIDIAGSLTVSGNIEIENNNDSNGIGLTIGDNKFRDEDGIFLYRTFDLGTSTSLATGISSGNWFCWIAGYNFGAGDINEDDSASAIMQVYTDEGSGGQWYIYADFNSHSDEHETHDIDIMCTQDAASVSVGGLTQELDWP